MLITPERASAGACSSSRAQPPRSGSRSPRARRVEVVSGAGHAATSRPSAGSAARSPPIATTRLPPSVPTARRAGLDDDRRHRRLDDRRADELLRGGDRVQRSHGRLERIRMPREARRAGRVSAGGRGRALAAAISVLSSSGTGPVRATRSPRSATWGRRSRTRPVVSVEVLARASTSASVSNRGPRSGTSSSQTWPGSAPRRRTRSASPPRPRRDPRRTAGTGRGAR